MKQLIICVLSYLCLLFISKVHAQENCETFTATVLQKLPSALNNNNFEQIENLINTIQSTCGETEFVHRVRIINKIIQKQPTDELIKTYQQKLYDEKLIYRFDAAAESNYASIYRKDKANFEYIPLRHPADSLIRVKASALLHSETYGLNHLETAICFLFMDDIEEYLRLANRNIASRKKQEKKVNEEYGKGEYAPTAYLGSFSPLNENPYLKTSPLVGLSLMSPLSNTFVFELMAKMRINSNNQIFEFNHENEVRDIKTATSFFLGISAGRKVFDQGSWIILPKIAAGLGFINTKLSSTTVYDAITSDEENYGDIKYNNVNTLHSSVGLLFMRHLHKKKFIGLEINYHHVPYNWDKDLISRIDQQYASIEVSFRF